MPSGTDAGARAKPRGSIAGLQQRQNQIVSKTREELRRAYEALIRERGDVPWKKIELARRAGLKSTVPLHSAINADILRLFEQHNQVVLAQISKFSPVVPVELCVENASTLAALLDAEVVDLQKENSALKRKVKELEKRLDAQKSHLRRQA